jgi:3-oxoacyl-[acyl-carrier protein] reductase
MLTREIPMQRLAEPLEAAYSALFFASDESRYSTGQSLVIDGGMVVSELPAQLSKV